MIEEVLMNYGILGIWTFTLLVERYNSNHNIRKTIENNTIALTKIYTKL